MTIAGRASGSAKREAPPWGRRGSKPAHPPRGHPRTQGPSSRDSASARSAGWGWGGGVPNGGDGTPGNPLRTSSAVPNLPPRPVGSRRVNVPFRPRHGGGAEIPESRAGTSDCRARRPSDSAQDGGGGSGNSRAASMVSDDRAMLQPLSSSIAGPVRPGRSHPKSHNHPTAASPSACSGRRLGAILRRNHSATPPRAPDKPIHAQPRPGRRAATTPTVARATVGEGRDSRKSKGNLSLLPRPGNPTP